MLEFSTELYDLSYDEIKNRIYFTMKGFCPSTDNIPQLLNQWKEVYESTEPNFTLLEDFSTLKTMPSEVYKLVVKLHLQLIRQNLAKIAIILPKKSDAFGQVKDITKLAILPFSTFESMSNAEKWLSETTHYSRKNIHFLV